MHAVASPPSPGWAAPASPTRPEAPSSPPPPSSPRYLELGGWPDSAGAVPIPLIRREAGEGTRALAHGVLVVCPETSSSCCTRSPGCAWIGDKTARIRLVISKPRPARWQLGNPNLPLWDNPGPSESGATSTAGDCVFQPARRAESLYPSRSLLLRADPGAACCFPRCLFTTSRRASPPLPRQRHRRRPLRHCELVRHGVHPRGAPA